jgi:hypothetical protein
MRRSQLAINCPSPLLQRLRTAAKQQGTTATALVLEWITAGLDGGLSRSSPPSANLEARLDALERRLDAMPASPIRGMGASPSRAIPPSPALVAGPINGAITTAELAQRTGASRGAWNTWASKATPGAIRRHATAGNWRLIGKAPDGRGGPPRWLWEPHLDET